MAGGDATAAAMILAAARIGASVIARRRLSDRGRPAGTAAAEELLLPVAGLCRLVFRLARQEREDDAGGGGIGQAEDQARLDIDVDRLRGGDGADDDGVATNPAASFEYLRVASTAGLANVSWKSAKTSSSRE